MGLSGIKMTGQRSAEFTFRAPTLAYRFKGESEFRSFHQGKAEKLLKSKNMYLPNMANAIEKIADAAKGVQMSFGTPLIFIDVDKERPKQPMAADKECERIFNSVFPGDENYVNGELQIDSNSSIGNRSHLKAGEYMDPQTGKPLHIKIVRSHIGERISIIDSYFEDSSVEGGLIGSKAAPSKENSFFSSFALTFAKNSILCGRFDLTKSHVVNSFIEFDQNVVEAFENLRFENTIFPFGRKLTELEMVGIMKEEITLAEFIKSNPSIFSEILKNLLSQSTYINLPIPIPPREGRITSVAAALVKIANDGQGLLLKSLLPRSQRIKDMGLEEVLEKFRLIAMCLNPKIAELINYRQ